MKVGWRARLWPILQSRAGVTALIFVLALVGIAILANDFGQSWDDPGDANYGEDVLRAYTGSSAFLNHDDRHLYGPAHFMLSAAANAGVSFLRLGWHEADVRHMMNALAFVVAAFSLFVLCRTLSICRTSSFATVLLFLTQPVLFGHAFVNQKDTPFMAAFLACVACGWLAVDQLASRTDIHSVGARSQTSAYIRKWKAMALGEKAGLGLLLLVSLIAWVEAISRRIILPAVVSIVTGLYQGAGPEWLVTIFQAAAEDAYKTPLSVYIDKVGFIHAWSSVALAVGLSVLAAWLFARVHPPGESIPRGLRSPLILWLLSACLFGWVTSIRPAGPMAALLVGAYAIACLRWKATGWLAGYAFLGSAISYLTWPYLWSAPIAHFVESLSTMADFRPVRVLFDGTLLWSTALPKDYLPRIMAYKLTEPALALIIAGLIYAIQRLVRSKDIRLALILVWSIVPIAAVVLFDRPIYNNIRQMLFTLPPMFIAAGLLLSSIIHRVDARRWIVPVGLGFLLTGLIPMIKLHPYEYTYFNSLVGGIDGAAGRYDMDYFCTSYREAMDYVNEHAGVGNDISIWGPDTAARGFAREDLILHAVYQPIEQPAFALRCGQAIGRSWFHPELDVVYEVGRGAAVFAEVMR